MKKKLKDQFDKAKKLRWIALISYFIAPFGLMLQGLTSPLYSYLVVGVLVITGFTLSFKYSCPNCGQVFHILTGPKKIKECHRCSMKFD